MKTQPALSRRLLLTTSVLTIALLTGAPRSGRAASPDAAPPVWRVVAASGQVEGLPRGITTPDWQPVARGSDLLLESRIRTGPDGRATLIRDKNVIIIDPDTELQLQASHGKKAGTEVHQQSGTATYRIHKARKQHFKVVTPYLVAGVKGTVFHVSVEDAFARVDVSEGLVGVRSFLADQEVDVRAGEHVRLDADAPRLEVARDDLRPVGTGADAALASARDSDRLYEDESGDHLDWDKLLAEYERLDDPDMVDETNEFDDSLFELKEELLREDLGSNSGPGSTNSGPGSTNSGPGGGRTPPNQTP